MNAGDSGQGAASEPKPKILDLDLTKEPIEGAQPLTSKRQLLNPALWEGLTRVGLAGVLVAVFTILTIGSGIVITFSPDKGPVIEAYLKLVFTPVLGLVSSVVGFYFGHQVGSSKS